MNFRCMSMAAAAALLLGAGQASADMDLARASGCVACHALETKIVGPSFKDINARYADNADARAILIDKTRSGGSGNWTDVTGGVPMPPYSPRVSDENIGTLIDFILNL